MPQQKWEFTNQSNKRRSWGWAMTMIIMGAFIFSRYPSSSFVLPDKPSQSAATFDSEDVIWQDMQRHIEDITAQHDGKVGIYIKDLKTGKVYEKRADDFFITASLIKIPIMAAAFNAIEEDKLSLDNYLKLRANHRQGGAGQLKRAKPGRQFRTSELIYRMITESDNTATAMLIDRLGYDYLNKNFANYGLVTTRINPTGMRLDDKINPELDNYTTPREMGQLLEKIYRRKVAKDGHCDLMMEWMKHVEGRARLRRYLPKTWAIANKGGLLRKNCHDVGIVFTPNRDYVICVLTGENRTYKNAIGLIANVGQAAYAFLDRS